MKKKSNLIQSKILKNIIRRREELGISQFKLAFKLHLTPNGYHKIEKGKTKLDVVRLFQIACVLDIDPKELIDISLKNEDFI